MGRRAKKAPVVTKKRATLAKRFKCPFCANEDAVECKMDLRNSVGTLKCRLCAASYQMPIHHLNEPIDVFSEWLDDCEAAANSQQRGGGADASVPRYNDEDDDDDDDDIPAAMEFNGGRKSNKDNNNTSSSSSHNNKKRPAQDTDARKKQKASSSKEDASKRTFTNLGLDDSDSDSDE